MNEIKEFRELIAASIYLSPCTEEELLKRDFLKTKSKEGVERMIMQLEKEALYYHGEIMHIKKEWAKKNLKDYDLDFRSEKQKYIDSLTPFARSIYGI